MALGGYETSRREPLWLQTHIIQEGIAVSLQRSCDNPADLGTTHYLATMWKHLQLSQLSNSSWTLQAWLSIGATLWLEPFGVGSWTETPATGHEWIERLMSDLEDQLEDHHVCCFTVACSQGVE